MKMEITKKPNRIFKVTLPMRIQSSRKKKTALNLNVYRNLHFRSLSAQKKNFSKIASKLLLGIPSMEKITLHYDIYPSSKRRLDVMNVGSIVDKYFSDTLVESGIIDDDDYTHIDFVSFGFGSIVKNEYVLVTITEIESKKDSKMRILLDQADIQKALEDFVETQGISGANGVNLSVEGGEITAEVMMGSSVDTDKPAPVKKKKGGRPAGSKNKPKEETADVETTSKNSDDSSDRGDTKTTKGKVDSTADENTKTESSNKAKNLFGAEENQSSKTSNSEEEPSDSEEAPKVVVKKSSIFDQ